MADKGWIKLHRQLQESPFWYGSKFTKGQAWVDLLLSANHSEKKILFNGEMVDIKRGQYLTSMVKLAEKWQWNRKTVSAFLSVLQKEGMITKVADNTKTLITIENYEVYQGFDDGNGQLIGQPIGQLIGQQRGNSLDNSLDSGTDTNNNVKNDKNDKNVKNERDNIPPISPKGGKAKVKTETVYYPDDEKLNQAFADFVDMRKTIKKPMTERAVTLAMNKLKKLSEVPFADSMDNDLAIQILEQSTMNCWQDLYPLKDNNRNNKKSGSVSVDWDNV